MSDVHQLHTCLHFAHPLPTVFTPSPLPPGVHNNTESQIELLAGELEASTKQVKVERENVRVVEAEMRALLIEQERQRHAKGIKAEQLRAVLAQLQADD